MKPFDANGAFRGDVEAQGGALRLIAVRGAGLTALVQVAKVGLQLTSMIGLARFLTPTDFGLVTMVTTFSLLVVNFGLNGFTEAVVQRPRIGRGLASNLFWINVGASTTLSVAFALSGSLLAHLYGDPRLSAVTAAIASTIFFTGLSVMHLALLKRAMRFSAVLANDLLAQFCSVGLSLLLAFKGWGYWSLVVGAVTLPLMSCIGAWLRCLWIPSLPRRNQETRPMVRFALNVYGFFAVNYCARNVDNLLVGWFFGPAALGFYKKAYDLAVFPVYQLSPLAGVAVPALSRLHGRDSERYSRYVLKSLSVLAFVGFGAGAVLTLTGQELILAILGPKWVEAGRIFRWFGPGIGAMFIYQVHGWLHFSIGKTNRVFRWGLIEFAALVILFLIGIAWGPVGVGGAWGVACWLLALPALWYAGRPVGFGVRPVIGAVWRFVAASALAGVISAVLLSRVIPVPSGANSFVLLGHVVLAAVVFGVLYIALVVALHGGLEPINLFLSLIRDTLPRRAKAAVPVAAEGREVVRRVENRGEVAVGEN